jgi:hypothetical protein
VQRTKIQIRRFWLRQNDDVVMGCCIATRNSLSSYQPNESAGGNEIEISIPPAGDLSGKAAWQVKGHWNSAEMVSGLAAARIPATNVCLESANRELISIGAQINLDNSCCHS